MAINITEKQLNTPHQVVSKSFNTNGMSILERSFSRQSLDEIMVWYQRGTLEASLSGKSRSSREYTSSLFDHLFSSMRYELSGYPRHVKSENEKEWNDILSYIWDRGAKNHPDHYDAWLSGASIFPFADTLIENGADPHRSFKKRIGSGSAIENLISAISFAQRLPERNKLSSEFVEKMNERLDRWIALPGIPVEKLDNTLAHVSCEVLNGNPSYRKQWIDRRDTLLQMGANPNASAPSLNVLVNLLQSRNIYLEEKITKKRLELYEEERNKGLNNFSSVDFNEKLKAYHDDIDKQWAQRLDDNLSVLLSYIVPGKNDRTEYNPPFDGDFWINALNIDVNGQSIAKKLLDAGIKAPWNDKPTESGYGHIDRLTCPITEVGRREKEVLSKFLTLVESHPIVEENRLLIGEQYFEVRNSRLHSSRSMNDWVHPEEVAKLIKIIRWDVSQTMPTYLKDWISGAPSNWEKRGFLTSQISSTPHPTFQSEKMTGDLAENLTKEIVSMGLFHKFMNESSDMENVSLVYSYRKFEKAYDFLKNLPDIGSQVRLYNAYQAIRYGDWSERKEAISDACLYDEENIEKIYKKAQDFTSGKGFWSQKQLMNYAGCLFNTVEVLTSIGWKWPEKEKNEYINSFLSRAADTELDCPTGYQVELVRMMGATGSLKDNSNPLIFLSDLSRQVGVSSGGLKSAALLHALFEEGCRPDLLPEITHADNPTLVILQSEQLRCSMERKTEPVSKKSTKVVRL